MISYSLGIRRDVYWQWVFENALPGISHDDVLSFCSKTFEVVAHSLYYDSAEPVVRSNSLDCTLASFISDSQSDPVIRLKVAFDILSVTHDPSATIYKLLEYTFRDTPCEVQSVSQKILAFLLSSHDDTILLKDVEEALHLDHSTTSQAIEQIRPFIFAWSPPSDHGTLYLHQRSQLDNLEEYKYLFQKRHVRRNPFYGDALELCLRDLVSVACQGLIEVDSSMPRTHWILIVDSLQWTRSFAISYFLDSQYKKTNLMGSSFPVAYKHLSLDCLNW